MSEGVPSAGHSATAAEQHVLGGVILVVLATILFIGSFFMRGNVQLSVRAAIIVFGLVSAAAAARLIPVRNPQDFFGGMALILLALVAFVASAELPGMRGFAFGPGTAPRLFATVLILLSLLVVVTGVLTRGPNVSRYDVRGTICILAAILVFAATIRPLGLVVASFSTVVVCAAAAKDVRWKETLLWAAVLTAFCSVLFPYGLNLPFQLWPRFWI